MISALACAGEPIARLEGNGERAALVVCVVGGDREALLEQLRARSSRSFVRTLGRDAGYRVEDIIEIVVANADPAWFARRIGREVLAIAGPPGAPMALAARFAGRIGWAPARERYAVGADGRVRVEAFELHVAEHCNLRCANCCNMSPLVGEKLLAVADVHAFVTRMATSLHADVVKIMGGEPLLHPEIATVIRVLREAQIGDRVRLFTNGLLLASMTDAFWEALDELTISNYASAPVKPQTLALARERARRHDFVLNVKPVDEFTQVLSPRYEADDAKVAETFERCWLRHRCLVVRGDRFYTCTRAAYADDFLRNVAHEPAPTPLDRAGDGLPLDTPDFASALAAYLDRPEPLGACRYCFGGDGASEPHHQLSRADVAAGLLSRRLPILGA
ncbi:MAG: radical SAM protein [Proteobacteria bacterium]|nr:radical SAM protein [Pseudomonadota bacterium]